MRHYLENFLEKLHVNENMVSLLVLVSCLLISSYYPKDSFLESVIVLIAFLFVIPYLYMTRVLDKTQEDLSMHMPTFIKRDCAALCIVLVGGSILGFTVLSLPYGIESYALSVEKIFASFKGFVIYEAAYTLPLIFISFFFGFSTVHALELSPWMTVVVSTLLVSLALFSSSLMLFFGTLIVLLTIITCMHFRATNLLTMTAVTFFLFVLFDTLFIKMHLSTL